MAKKKRKPKTPDPASFAFGIMQHVVEATGDKPDEPKPAPDQAGKDPAAVALGAQGRFEGGAGEGRENDQGTARGQCQESGGGPLEKEPLVTRTGRISTPAVVLQHQPEAPHRRSCATRESLPRRIGLAQCRPRLEFAAGSIRSRSSGMPLRKTWGIRAPRHHRTAHAASNPCAPGISAMTPFATPTQSPGLRRNNHSRDRRLPLQLDVLEGLNIHRDPFPSERLSRE